MNYDQFKGVKKDVEDYMSPDVTQPIESMIYVIKNAFPINAVPIEMQKKLEACHAVFSNAQKLLKETAEFIISELNKTVPK